MMHAACLAVAASALAWHGYGYGPSDDGFTFKHGVASGDAGSCSMVLWSRVTPPEWAQPRSNARVRVDVAVCESDDGVVPYPQGLFLPAWAHGHQKREWHSRCFMRRVTTGEYRDFTVKVEPGNLKSNTVYYYQFRLSRSKVESPIGRTMTLPDKKDGVDEMTYAVVSCANYGHGLFHVYDLLANAEKLDLWLHVGDYIYEYGSYTYPAAEEAVKRNGEYGPFREIVTLDEYRQRHALYKTESSLQKLHARAPVYAIWDDHEITNDARSDGAENHQPTCPTPMDAPFTEFPSANCDRDEGEYDRRKRIATRAYYEWMPVSERHGALDDPAVRLERHFEAHFGDLISFAGYETRISQRTQSDTTDLLGGANPLALAAFQYADPSEYDKEPTLSILKEAARQTVEGLDETAELMGEGQRNAMRRHFAQSKRLGAPWQVLATPIPMGRRVLPDVLSTQGTLADTLMAYGASAEQAQTLAGGFAQINSGALADASFRLGLVLGGRFGVPWNSDAWDGYPTEREKVLQTLAEVANNPVVVAGDSHNAYAGILRTGDAQTGTPVAVEYDTAAVSSPGFEAILDTYRQFLGAPGLDILEHSMRQRNEGVLEYLNLKDRGFVLFNVNRTAHEGEFVFVNTDRAAAVNSNAGLLRNPEYNLEHYCDARLTAEAGKPGQFTRVQAPEFFVPVACKNTFDRSFYNRLFASQN